MAALVPVFPEGRHALYERHGYSAGVVVGDLLFVSGQVGVDIEGKVLDGVEEQTRQAFLNLEAVLHAAGATFADVVDMTIYIVDMPTNGDTVIAVRRELFPEAPFPTLTGIGVAALWSSCKVEIKVVARVPGAAD